jgi:hypothetical protein
MKNYIFYHCTPISDYKERFHKTFEKIKKHNLLSKAEKFFFFLNGETDENFNIDPKIEIIKTPRHPNESRTINSLRSFCKSNLYSNVLYLHNKGVTKTPEFIKNVNAWVDLMEYFLIEKHEQCVRDLITCDAVGTLTRDTPKFHFSGNFWWANAKYINLLDECNDEYYAPEMWHLSKTDINKIKCYFNTYKDLYHNEIKKEEYEHQSN